MKRRIAGVVASWLLVGTVMAADIQGMLGWSARSEMGTLVSGVVNEVPVILGQRVARGALLLQLDNREFKVALKRAQARYERAKVLHDEARREDERSAELYDRTLLSDHERQLAAIALSEASAELESAKSDLVESKLALERSALVAPADGVIVGLNAAPGQVVVSELQSQPLLVFGVDRPMLVRVDMELAQLAAVSVGDVVRVAVREQWYDARIHAIGVEPVRKGERGPLYSVEAAFEPPAGMLLRAGEPAVLRLKK